EDAARKKNWKRWGPYLAERQWGTVREDYSADSEAWNYFTHEDARRRAYRWGEDGLLGITDREGRLCFSLALWNERDPFLKERLFGLTNSEGNHGEDVKECYYYLDATPTHSWLKALYKYPQAEFPYAQLREESRKRNRTEPEYELTETRVFDGNRYFDVFAEYAKAGPDDILIQITVANRGPVPAPLHVLPTLWFRNTWSWGCKHEGCEVKPRLHQISPTTVQCDHTTLNRFVWEVEPIEDREPAPLIFTENETNAEKLFGAENASRHVKDAFHDYVVEKKSAVVNPRKIGTKVAAHYQLELAPGEERVIRLRLYSESEKPAESFGKTFDRIFQSRKKEADQFYDAYFGDMSTGTEERRVARQACAGLLWSKQFYHYIVGDWLEGDPEQPTPPEIRKQGRNHDWPHFFARDILSVPDKWEYPWFAAWDLSFHMIPFARLDPEFAKGQLNLLLREWYQHPNGQIPAYEYAFTDVNPPVHAWACWRVYKMSGDRGKRDRLFLSRVFQKLLVNFTWWVNRKDPQGRHVFSGGFLGLDNIGVFDRSKPLPGGGMLDQADGTAWMAFYCGTMLSMALELAGEDPAYEDIASKFFEHFVAIADAMNHLGGTGLWNEEDGFYYDQLLVEGKTTPVRMRSLVGVIPLFAVEILDQTMVDKFPGFAKRTRWFLENRRDLSDQISHLEKGDDNRLLLAIPTRDRLKRVLSYLFDSNEFLSDYGIRSLSKLYEDRPYKLKVDGTEYKVCYNPGDSDSWIFGGNSNWRGPIWFPLNYLLIEALQRYHHFFGESFTVEFPTGSGVQMNLEQIARDLAGRLIKLFLPNEQGRRPCHGYEVRYVDDPHWHDLLLFHEYFHGENGRGLGANHQTGWTALVARLIGELGTKGD
ncbi:MAG TPA: hypothetical protein VKC60_02320, partial [Opitutaceae bacterium]|nr:hypothetical protein [Opitutaceae bacterium]